MNAYYLTFPNKYRREPHPSGITLNPDGYVTVRAESHDAAREVANRFFGKEWANLHYDKEIVDRYFYAGSFLEVK